MGKSFQAEAADSSRMPFPCCILRDLPTARLTEGTKKF